jgi:hypothetical protein
MKKNTTLSWKVFIIKKNRIHFYHRSILSIYFIQY